MPATSFYAPVPEVPRDDALRAYLAFLEDRNGSLDPTAPFPAREAWLVESEGWTARHAGSLDPAEFERGFTGGRTDTANVPLQALLGFVRMNAGEAYGVEVVRRIRQARPVSPELFDRVERLLGNEETYHTRILLGATRQFDLPPPTAAWKPSLALKGLITSLAYSPKALFHPILLGSELGGVFLFNWALRRVGALFRDQPELRETLERRLIEVLIDEVGHVAFNRLAVGPTGLATARRLGPHVADATSGQTPEFRTLGWSRATLAEYDHFDLSSLPEEVRRRSFFV